MKLFFKLYLFLISIKCFGWTTTYVKKLNFDNIVSTNQLKFSKKTSPFTQLIFSFNSLRPSKGKFTFFVQAYLKGRGWTSLYKAMEWGNGVQQTFLSEPENVIDPTHFYVRFEIPKNLKGEAFRILVKSSNAKYIQNLKSVSVCVSDYSSFKSEVGNKFSFPNVVIDGIPAQSQMVLNHEKANSICSPTSLAMVLSYLTKKKINFEEFADKVFDHGLGVHGSWPFNVSSAYEIDTAHHFRVQRMESFKNLYHSLAKGFPVVVSVRGELKGAAKPYPHGHLLVVRGWDNNNKKVLVNDPAFDDNSKVVTSYNLNDFLKAWERSYYLSYVVEEW